MSREITSILVPFRSFLLSLLELRKLSSSPYEDIRRFVNYFGILIRRFLRLAMERVKYAEIKSIFFERIFHSDNVFQELCKYAFIWFYHFLTHTKFFYMTSNIKYFDSNLCLIRLNNVEILNSLFS